MPTFQLWDHPQLPLVMATAETRRRDRDKSGFRPRYVVEITSRDHADDVIRMLDDAMGEATRAHGVYQARYDDVRAAYGALLASAGPPPRNAWDLAFRAGALLLGAAVLALAVSARLVMTALSLAFCALRGRSGAHVMLELHVITALTSPHGLVRRLWGYALNPYGRARRGKRHEPDNT